MSGEPAEAARQKDDRSFTRRLADLCTMPGLGGSGPVSRWNQWVVAFHGLFYASLGAATFSALSDPGSTAQARLAGSLSLLVAAWYGYWMVFRQDLMVRRSTARGLFFAGAGLLWTGLLALDRDYAILAFAGFAMVFGYLKLRLALVAAGIVALLLTGAAGLAGSPGTPAGLRWVGIALDDLVDPVLALGLVALFALWARAVVQQSTERERFIDDLQAARQELALAEREAGILQERQRLAAEIHDTLTQELASVVMLLEAAQASASTGGTGGSHHVEQALRSARESLREIRGLVWSLRPEALQEGTLEEALAKLTSALNEQTGIVARSVVTGTPRGLPTEVEVTLLRAAQEALANVRRHSGASQVTITLSHMEDVVVLDVRDDGVGFDVGPVPAQPREQGGLGLVTMRERVEGLHGSITVESAAGEGTTVMVAIPVEPAISPTPPEPSDAAVR